MQFWVTSARFSMQGARENLGEVDPLVTTAVEVVDLGAAGEAIGEDDRPLVVDGLGGQARQQHLLRGTWVLQVVVDDVVTGSRGWSGRGACPGMPKRCGHAKSAVSTM